LKNLKAMPSILFVCSANLYRSPLAAAYLRHEMKDVPDGKEWLVDSAGTWTKTGTPVHPQTVEDARLFGLDIRAHSSKQITGELLSRNDLILVMETGQKEALLLEFPNQSRKIYLLSEVVDGRSYNIPDPFSLEGDHDRDIAIELHQVIKRGYKEILALAKSNSNPIENNTELIEPDKTK
jgi:protein-tyrosine phosphatase